MRQRLYKHVVAPTPIWLSVVIGLSACTPISEYQRAKVTLPDRYSLITPVSSASVNRGLAFSDPVLDQLMSEAVSGNLSIAEAQERLREAAANVRRSGAKVSGDGGMEISRSSTGPSTGGLTLNAAFSVFGMQRATANAASARFDAAKLSELDARRVVMSELAAAYVDLRYYQQTLVYRQRDLGLRQAILRDVTAQTESRGATRVDLVQTQAQVAEAQGQIPILKATIIQQRNQISTLLGRPVGSLNIDLGFSGHQPQPQGGTSVGVPADLIRARPDIQRAEQLYAAAVSDIDAAQAARYPRLSLSGSIRAPLEGGSSVESLVAGLVIPVFSQNALAADVDAAHARANLAFLQWRGAVLTAVEDVESSLAVMQGAAQAVQSSQRVVSLNREASQLSRELLKSGGDITLLDVLDREREVSDSQIALAQNLRSYALNYIALQTALGLQEIETSVAE